MNTVFRQRVAIAVGGIAVVGTLAGCSASAADAPAPQASGTYADGDYSATGEYQSPGGSESIEVGVTLADNIVTEVTVAGNATEGNALRYQTEFENGIAAEVVGRNIDELEVDRVAGSSLTSDGFNDAIEQIKAEAVA